MKTTVLLAALCGLEKKRASEKPLPAGLTPIRNEHKVARRTWAKWTEQQRRRFNQLFELMRDHQRFFVHTDAPLIPEKHWRVTCWNAAFMAADGEVR